MTPELMKVHCPKCCSPEEIEIYGPDEKPYLVGGCSVCQYWIDEDKNVNEYVTLVLKQRKQSPSQRAQAIVTAIQKLFTTDPEYNGRELL
jgi:hypothetical protein